jgi:hypothetical protein
LKRRNRLLKKSKVRPKTVKNIDFEEKVIFVVLAVLFSFLALKISFENVSDRVPHHPPIMHVGRLIIMNIAGVGLLYIGGIRKPVAYFIYLLLVLGLDLLFLVGIVLLMFLIPTEFSF